MSNRITNVEQDYVLECIAELMFDFFDEINHLVVLRDS